jgi:phosphoserine/homoserine phosphotransferase
VVKTRPRGQPPPEELVIVACLDLEGVLVPEIWIHFAEHTGIDELRRTTRDEPDYDVLMRRRLAILAENGLGLPDIEEVIGGMKPLPGAAKFLGWLKERFQVLILSDTFYPFAKPLMAQLDYPILFCHDLAVADDGRVTDYHIRLVDQKRAAVKALHGLNFQVIASGDSYNDTSMLSEADAGILFRPPENVIAEFPQYPVATDYDAMRREFAAAKEQLV